MKEQIENIRREIEEALSARADMTGKELYALKMEYLGKTGKISALSKGMRDVAPEERPAVGKLVGEVRQWAEERFAALEEEIGRREEDRCHHACQIPRNGLGAPRHARAQGTYRHLFGNGF